jgi:hypothetical protein
MKQYEICYLGGRYGSKRSYKFKITQILEFSPTGEVKEFTKEEFLVPPTLTFGKVPIKNLRVGDYLNVESENDTNFKNFQRCIRPSNPLSSHELLKADAEEKAKMMERNAINTLRDRTNDIDKVIDQLKTAMWDLSSSQRKSFALYVYQKLTK